MLTDNFKRKIDYLRISVTDRCDLRCTYCMAEDVTFLPRQEVLSIEEIIKLTNIFNELGVKKFRLTGGEPLVRKNIVSIIEHLNNLKTESFKKITKWGDLSKVLNGIEAAKQEGIKIKINTVLTQNFNDKEIFDILDWCKKNHFDISLIEIMPIGDIGEKRFNQYLSMKKFEEDLVNKLNLIPSKHRTNGPSRYYEYSNHKSKIGIISAISHNFCDTCNRVRLTCTGKLYMCLGQNDFVDLKFALRNQTKNDIIALIEYAMSIKPKAHNFEIQKDNFEGYVNRYMNETGG